MRDRAGTASSTNRTRPRRRPRFVTVQLPRSWKNNAAANQGPGIQGFSEGPVLEVLQAARLFKGRVTKKP